MQRLKEFDREQVLRIIVLCQAIRLSGQDPFTVDVKEKLQILRELLPKWKLVEDLLLDSEALKELSEIVKLQGEWVRRRASRMFIDPFLIEAKLKLMDREQLARAFLKAWRPIISTEQLTFRRLKEAYDYWAALPPLSERKHELTTQAEFELKHLDIEELIKMRLLTKEEFEKALDELYEELLARSRGEAIDYWSFVVREGFEESAMRAYMVSFLVSQGRAELFIDPIQEVIYIKPAKAEEKKVGRSVVVAFNYDVWRRELERVKRERGSFS
ncbi:MAG: hypothetical protein DRJ31_05390 [Candidatus Methanomethylicota archaeon]|uniref:Uncharacterized protein n=1 Tax=Thermoproteota archaeon TaxID=2056631 RepID=A0A497ERW3_9CREN|nr:MAG: hypothetical protein DRJ31_05390 [Candidatus Verstraetearchaeota archaeon]